MIARCRAMYGQYPRSFWVLVAGTFVDVIGESALFPFFALYVTGRFQVGMAVAGGLFGVVSLSGLVGGILGARLPTGSGAAVLPSSDWPPVRWWRFLSAGSIAFHSSTGSPCRWDCWATSPDQPIRQWWRISFPKINGQKGTGF